MFPSPRRGGRHDRPSGAGPLWGSGPRGCAALHPWLLTAAPPGLTPESCGHSCPRGAYQSDPSTAPSYGWQALYQVMVATVGLTVRTLPSPRPVTMALGCGECVTFCWQASELGVVWNGMPVPGAPA